MNSAVVVVVPVIIPQGPEIDGPVPWWAWIVVGAIVVTFLAIVGWAVYDEWTWERRHRR